MFFSGGGWGQGESIVRRQTAAHGGLTGECCKKGLPRMITDKWDQL